MTALPSLIVLLTGTAHALDASGFHVGATTGDPACYTRLGCPGVPRAGDWDAGVLVDHADTPLAEVLPEGRTPIVSSLATVSTVAAVAVKGLRVDAVVPVHVFGSDPTGGFSAMGDVRVGAQLAFPLAAGPTVSVRSAVWAPTGDEAHYVGAAGARVLLAGAVAQEIGPFGVLASLGAMAALPSRTRDLEEGLGPVGGIGVAWRASDAVSAALELSAATDLAQLPIEASLSARARLPVGAWATLGGAAGVGEGVGASRWRAWIGLGFSHRAPPPPPPPPPLDPTADRDGDGIFDAADDCVDQAETVDGFEDDDGCPELDGDGDGVAFDRDACPREAIRPEQDPRWSDGCPKVAEFAGDRIVITEAIFFKEGRAELLASSTGVLEAVRGVMEAHPEIGAFLVEGHANANGSDVFNLRLSDARAYAVMRWLSEHGVAGDRLLSKGYGETRPLVPGSDPDALAINRRVEFRVVRIEQVPPDARRLEPPPDAR